MTNEDKSALVVLVPESWHTPGSTVMRLNLVSMQPPYPPSTVNHNRLLAAIMQREVPLDRPQSC
jgi:hypothetical protein